MNNFKSPISKALSEIEGVSEIEEKTLSDEINEDNTSLMTLFKFHDVNCSALVAQTGEDNSCGINLRAVISIEISEKKSKEHILNDLNKFNHSKLGIKVVLLNVKDTEIKVSFDVETWTFIDLISVKTTELNLNYLFFSMSLLVTEHSYMDAL